MAPAYARSPRRRCSPQFGQADPEQEYFVDGIDEEISTALSRIRWLSVIARNSSFTGGADAN